MRRLKSLWDLLQEYEQRAHIPEINGLLRQMLWPQSPWIREVPVELAEAKWMHVPRRLHD